jgi:hypothetical protein
MWAMGILVPVIHVVISRIPLSVIQLLELLLGDHWVFRLHPTINLSVSRTAGHLSFGAEKEVNILHDVVLSTNWSAKRWLGQSCGAERVVVVGRRDHFLESYRESIHGTSD